MHRAELRDLLSHPSHDPRFVERFKSLLAEPGDIFSRHHFVPGHVTASAVVTDESRTRILLIDHTKLRRWLQPGGHVEPSDESLVAAARREVIEECGPLELDTMGVLDIDVHEIPPLGGEPAHGHFDVRILMQVTGGEIAPTGEVSESRWFPLDAPPDNLGSSVDRLIAKVRA